MRRDQRRQRQFAEIADASLHRWTDVDCIAGPDTVDALAIFRFAAERPVVPGQDCPQLAFEAQVFF